MTEPLPTPARMLQEALRHAGHGNADLAQAYVSLARELREGAAAERRDAPAWAAGDRAEFPVAFHAGDEGPADPGASHHFQAGCGYEGHPAPMHLCKIGHRLATPGEVRHAQPVPADRPTGFVPTLPATAQTYDATTYGDQAHDQTVILHAHTEQPMPVPNAGTSVQALVRRDLEDREQVGIQRYGTPLQAHNGRDALRDAYEEALDLACYLRQALEEGR